MAPEPTLLTVDDDVARLQATSLLLSRAGYPVATASSGTDALQLTRATRPRLLLLDVELPDLPGPEVLRQIRADPALQSVSVVFLSAQRTQPVHRVLSLGAGADGYIARPISDEELLARVHSHWRQGELADQLRSSEARFRDLILRQADGVVVVSQDGAIRFANPAAEALFGRPVANLLQSLFGFPVDGAGSTEIEIRQPAGQTLQVEMRVAPTTWEQQPAWLATLRDLTERQLAENQIQDQLHELQRWYRITMGRESRVLELKREVNDLLLQAGQPPRYPSVAPPTAPPSPIPAPLPFPHPSPLTPPTESPPPE